MNQLPEDIITKIIGFLVINDVNSMKLVNSNYTKKWYNYDNVCVYNAEIFDIYVLYKITLRQNIDKIPSIALSFNNIDYYYSYEFSFDKFIHFYKTHRNEYLIQNIDIICSNLRNNVNRAIYNNRSDYIDISNRSINDIIELIYALKHKNDIIYNFYVIVQFYM